MPRYFVNGKWYRSETPLTDDELEELGGPEPSSGPEQPGMIGQAWDWLNTPFTDLPSRAGKAVADYINPESATSWSDPRAIAGAFAEGVGNTVENMFFTPGGAALSTLFPGSSALAGRMPATAQAMRTAGRALSVPYGLHGAHQAVTADTWPERAMGAAEAVGGYLGARSGLPAKDPFRRGPTDLNWEMEDLGNVPSGPTGGPPPRQAQRSLPPPRTQIPDITETFPYEEYTTPPPPPPTDPRISSIAPYEPPEFAVDESGRHLGGYVGQPSTPWTPPNITHPNMMDQAPPPSASEIELANQRAEIEALKAQMRAMEDAQLGVTAQEQANMRGGGLAAIERGMGEPPQQPIQQPPPPPIDYPAPEPNPFQMEQPPQSMQLAQPEPIWPTPNQAQPIWPQNTAEQRFPAFPNEAPQAPQIQPPPPVTQPPATSAEAIVSKIKAISKKKAPAPPPAPAMQPPTVPQQATPLPVEPPVQQLPPAPQGFADAVVPPTVNDVLQGAQAPLPNMPVPPTTGPVSQQAQQAAMGSIMNALKNAETLARNRVTDPTQWEALRAEIETHTGTLRAAAKRGGAIQGAEDILRAAGGDFARYQQLAATKKAGGLRPKQKFTQPPKPYVAPEPEPVAPGEPVIARSADQVQELLEEGYKVTSRTTDGGIVMEPPKSLPETEGARIAGKRKFDYGAARAKAKELGLKIPREARLKDIHDAIREKDPSWTPPESTVKEPPTESHEWQPAAGGGGGRGTTPPNQGPHAGGGNAPPPPNSGGGIPPPNQPPNWTPGNQQPPPRAGNVGGRTIRPPKEQPWYKKLYNLSRGLMSVDPPFITSAAFRQGLPWIGTKYWLQAWKNAFKAYGSERAYAGFKQALEVDPLFRVRPRFRGAGSVPNVENSIASQMGLKLGDLTDEILAVDWAEKIPGWGKHVAGSNRAYNTFLNHLRAYTYKQLITDAGIWDGANITNEALARELADFVNTSTGRGKLEFTAGVSQKYGKTISFEQSAERLADVMFSPRLIASRVKMLNPSTYLMASPEVRQQYLKAMMRTVGAWWTFASLAEMAGAEVSKDPTNADYGKIRLGNTRIDPGGGFQQFLVAGARMLPEGMQPPPETGIPPADLALGFLGGGGGVTSSVSGQFNRFGEGYKPETRMSTLGRFAVSKLHPTLKLAVDILNASSREPVYLGDRLMQMAAPLMAGDLLKLAQEDPSLIPIAGLTTGIGMGGQTYEGGIPEPQLMPEALQDYDIVFGGN